MRLRELRKSRGISQVKLAMDLNMAQNTVSRYETGTREPLQTPAPETSAPDITE